MRIVRLLPVLLLLSCDQTCDEDGPVPVAEATQDPAAKAPAVALENAFPAQKGFERPVYLDWHAGDAAHYYVLEQPGRILRIPRDGKLARRDVFLDWTAQTYTAHNEEGLLGLAFDPEHHKTGAFYVYYSHGLGRRGRESVISRFVAKDGVTDPKSERVVMRIAQPAGNHNGGTLVFGPDKMLYVALGDGGAAGDPWNNAQNKAALLGKVLRIDVLGGDDRTPYLVPRDNPFVGVEGAKPEIWCYGMRNPWRITFDRATGDLWCGDVGQDLWEEVDRLEKGKNYGWNRWEGTHPFPPRAKRDAAADDVVPPIVEYHHEEGKSITGGYVYRGKKIPGLVGAYVYADYVSGKLWCVREKKGATQAGTLLLETKKDVASFAEEPDGELLLLCFDGRIWRLVPK